MVPRIGIDLGTTFSCVAWVDEDGRPQVIPNAEGELMTPSVICFNGRDAWVGEKANAWKPTRPNEIREFVKRDMGKPVMTSGGSEEADVAPYEVNGFQYGAAGMSALILRKIKRDALRFFRKRGIADSAVDEQSARLDAVITVPAYFGGQERDATKLAGYAAGLNVIGIINEPTAAALSYGLVRQKDAKILVFDLGGGTLDVTILQMRHPEAVVLTTMGDNSIGGKEWDALIESYIYESFERTYGHPIPEDGGFGFEIQKLALKAKFQLSEQPQAVVSLTVDDQDLDVTLFEQAPLEQNEMTSTVPFYFEQRAAELLHRCAILCERALARVTVPTPSGGSRSLVWSDVDEIILAGGACRMPMVPRMLEQISQRSVRRHIEGFNYDTAVAIGAALYSHNRGRVIDVMSHTVGVLVSEDGRQYVEPIIRKDAPLPAEESRRFSAAANAFVEVYEVTQHEGIALKDESRLRGRLDLDNSGAMTQVLLTFEVDVNGLLRIVAKYPPDEQRELALKDASRWSDEQAERLRDRVMAVKMN